MSVNLDQLRWAECMIATKDDEAGWEKVKDGYEAKLDAIVTSRLSDMQKVLEIGKKQARKIKSKVKKKNEASYNAIIEQSGATTSSNATTSTIRAKKTSRTKRTAKK